MSDTSTDSGVFHLKLKAYKDLEFSKPLDVEEFEATVNPDTFDRNINIQYKPHKSKSKTVTLGRLISVDAETYGFSILLDGTGIISAAHMNVQKELDKFDRVLFRREGKSCIPNPVQIQYCGQFFNCKVTSLGYNYTLFDVNGNPLRVKIKCSFSSVAPIEKDKEPKKKESEENNACECVCPVPDNSSPEANQSVATESDANSLMSVYTPESYD
ncbi:MAG: hypothetical protein IKP81_07485 [Paludibacteraceae bacterium]|nr:hypothetical protein [Paludibacteraceae bacterium]